MTVEVLIGEEVAWRHGPYTLIGEVEEKRERGYVVYVTSWSHRTASKFFGQRVYVFKEKVQALKRGV